MKFKIHILLFVFSAVTLIIGIYQFTKNETWEPILSIIYFLMFLMGAIISLKNNEK
jgi:hypothetical protein